LTDEYSDDFLRDVLQRVRRVAVVGMSPNQARPSNYVAAFLARKGYQIYPVNPGHAGKIWHGAKVYPSLGEIPVAVDMVDIFRRSDAVPGVVDEALAACERLDVIWMQLGVMHDGAAQIARARGVTVIQDRCPMIEHPRLL
jgi:uncharacterized protein